MNSDDPYTPVRIPVNRVAVRNRPYYIYSTAVVMLLWAGIYVYLQSQYAVSAESEGVTTPDRHASRLYEFNVVTIAVLFALSLAIVNSAIWAILKIINR